MYSVNIFSIVASLFFIQSMISHPVRAAMNVDWKNQGLNYTWTITSANSNEQWEFDCGNALTGDLCSMLFLYGRYANPTDTIFLDEKLKIRGKRSISYIVQNWSRTLPKSGSVYNLPYRMSLVPGGYFLLYVKGGNKAAFLIGSSQDGWINPPPPPTPDPVSCSLDGSIDLPHGVLAADALAGNVKSITKRVTCSRQATVKITARANNGTDVVTLRSDGSLKSQLKVNNANGSTGSSISVPGATGASVTFSSTLITSGKVAPGTFSGSAVAVVSIL